MTRSSTLVRKGIVRRPQVDVKRCGDWVHSLRVGVLLLSVLTCSPGCATRPLSPSRSESVRNDYYRLADGDPVARAAKLTVEMAGMSNDIRENRVRLCVYQTRNRYFVELIPNYCDTTSEANCAATLREDESPDRLPGELVEVGYPQAFVLSRASLRALGAIPQGELEHTPRLFYGTNGDIRYCSLFGPLEDAGVIRPMRR